MPQYIIGGIPVSFPFEPYDIQKNYMEKVISCVRNGTNGILESPTGTGKTLSLLCSTMAFIESEKIKLKLQGEICSQGPKTAADELKPVADFSNIAKNMQNWSVPRVIYASRTHSQISQAMQELKSTEYSKMTAVVQGSRDQLCIHPEVMREQGNSNKIQSCKLRVTTRTCSFHARVEACKDHPEFRKQSVMDIEDLVKVGQKVKACPYYISKELHSDADITFMPYNYLIDPKARKANKTALDNAIVILDEAHNIEKICEESASVHIRSSDIAMAIDEITEIMKSFDKGIGGTDYSEEEKDFSIDELATLKEMLLNLEKAIDDIIVENLAEGITFPAIFIFELLQKANLTLDTAKPTIGLLEKLLQFLTVAEQNGIFRKGAAFQIISDFLTIVFVNQSEDYGRVYRSFKVHIVIEETKQTNRNTSNNQSKDGWISKPPPTTTSLTKGKVIYYWCFNPGFGMDQLARTNVRSIILTSGTLAPLQPLIAELGIPMAEKLENPHIVGPSQVYVKIIGSGPDREKLISNYANRDNPKYIKSLGQTILNVSRIVPGGLLVFFPSYPLLNKCVDSWQASGVWSNIGRYKPIFTEPRGKNEFNSTMESYYQMIRDTNGACFMAVCRGKVSEGLDFADQNGRAVILVGLPFPPLKDAKVILKRRYLEDNRTKENELLNGQDWYALEATRAVNQAMGRVIRHRHDYGAILLCDERFQYPSQVRQYSKWIREHLGNSPQSVPFGAVVRDLCQFFKNADKTLPKPKDRSLEKLTNENYDNDNETVTRSIYFDKPKLKTESTRKIELAQMAAMHMSSNSSTQSGNYLADYKATASLAAKLNKSISTDFMGRLNTNMTTIDFNSMSGTGNSSNNGDCGSKIKNETANNLVTIHKRERLSPGTSCSSSVANETSTRKRYKLFDNNMTTNFNQIKTEPSTSTTLPLANNQNLKNVVEDASTNRREFLKLLRQHLSEKEFEEFSTSLLSYGHKDTFEEFITTLFKVFGKPELHFMLQSIRKFLKSKHKTIYDERLDQFLKSFS